MSYDLRQGFRLGPWKIEPLRGAITGTNGQAQHLKPKVMDVFVCLAEHSNKLVSRDQLLESVWSEHVAADELLTGAVSDLRRILQYDRGDPQHLETIPKRGYRLIGQVRPLEDTDLEEHATSGSVAAVQSARRHKTLWAVGFAVVAVMAVLVGLNVGGLGDRLSGGTSLGPVTSIAVLPFVNMSSDPAQEYFSDGISQEILNVLTKVPELRVISRSSAFSFKGQNVDIPTIAAKLNVSHVLEGSVRKSGNQLRITAQLIEVVTDTQLWSATYNRNLEDIFAIQEEIATSVSGALGVRLGVGGVNSFQGAGTRNIEAYEAYLQGLGTGWIRHYEKIRFFERATQLDPNYSAAWSQLGLNTSATQWISNPEEAPEIKERAYAFVRRAVELDPESALSTSLLGSVLYPKYDWIRGAAAHLRALSLLSDRPNLMQYGNLLMRTGRSAAALEQWKKAEAVEPLGGRPVGFRAYVALAQGRFADAREVLARSPANHMYPNRISIALNEGDSEDIKATIAAMPATAISTTALYSPVLSVFDSPEMVLSTLRATYADNGSRWPSKLHDIALLAAYFGDSELALQTIGEEVRNTVARLQAVWYPMMSEVRKSPGFKELVTDLNLVAYWRASGWADLCRPLGDDDFECI